MHFVLCTLYSIHGIISFNDAMNSNRKIIILIGIGILLLVGILVTSLTNVMVADNTLVSDEETRAQEIRGIETIMNELGGMSLNIHQYLMNKKERYQQAYQASRDTVNKMLDSVVKQYQHPHDRQLATAIRLAVQQIDEPANQLFMLSSPLGRDRIRAYELTIEMDGLLAGVEQRIQRFMSDERAEQMNNRAVHFSYVEKRNAIFFLLTVFLSISFLLGFGVYIRRKVTLPLNDVWKNVTGPGADSPDRPVLHQKTGGIVPLTRQLSEAVQDLRHLYAELEHQILNQTSDFARIESVTLMPVQSGDVRDMLTKSLRQILNSLADMELKGGAFLCDQNGETLSLVAHQGLPEEFVHQEATIKIGECLCGIAAQTGEIIYTEKSCNDPRHTRGMKDDKHAHVIIPIKSRGTVLGVIFLYPRMGFQLKQAELQMLETVGTQLGLAMENLELYATVNESSGKYLDLFENAREILFTMDSEGRLTAVNKAAVRFTGYTKAELVGKSIFDFLTPDGAQTARNMLAGKGGPGKHMEFEAVTKNNKRAVVDVLLRKLPKDQAPAEFHISVRDVTKQKAIREKLMQAERLGAVEQLVAATRHEINNPLSTIIGNAELLLDHPGEPLQDEELLTRLETILNNALRIADIVKRMQDIKQDRVVEYRPGIKMTDLRPNVDSDA